MCFDIQGRKIVLQQELFGSTPVTIAADGDGGIRYLPGCIESSLANCWFEFLLKNCAWGAYRRTMYDREVAVPRLISGYMKDAEKLP
ncbi:putative alkylated DNA repair protein (plasmid) [Caballeronia insecticola]|uniref:Putative alkylated DNA repair protein n=1 Tax=Caballeronia insecticola TaxID=758793 RepID=R4X4H5_9BURK|nr:putative alkylated DNA repair protein [Caballeronia insecticola]